MPYLIQKANESHEKLACKMALQYGIPFIVTSGNDEKVCEVKTTLPYVIALEDVTAGQLQRMMFNTKTDVDFEL